MQIYGSTHVHGSQPVSAPHAPRATEPQQAPASASMPSDQLDISSAGQMLDSIRDLPEIRHERVQALRAAIADGTYETADKLDGAIEHLLDEIG
jgi:flagellar biosynthesis anti-sigma factor FlgM